MPQSLKTTKPATREAWLARFTELARPHFKAAGHPIPKKVRVGIGFSSKGARSNTIGECWAPSQTVDGVSEIFIVPSLQDDSSRIADVLTHELCHAALPWGTGHGKAFKLLATSLGLTGKMTATVAGEGWHAWADPILKELGKFPGAKLDNGHIEGGKKKQTTRMVKLTCDECGWSCRTTRSHIDGLHLNCAVLTCGGLLEEQ